jgi:hypothetical protein
MVLKVPLVDDTSPLWKYAGKWQDAGDADAGTPNYSQNAFHSTDVPGSNVTLKFNGTAVTVYGSKWFNHVRRWDHLLPFVTCMC